MKQYRFTLNTQWGNVPGIWRDYDSEEFAEQCRVFGDNDAWFTVEFRRV